MWLVQLRVWIFNLILINFNLIATYRGCLLYWTSLVSRTSNIPRNVILTFTSSVGTLPPHSQFFSPQVPPISLGPVFLLFLGNLSASIVNTHGQGLCLNYFRVPNLTLYIVSGEAIRFGIHLGEFPNTRNCLRGREEREEGPGWSRKAGGRAPVSQLLRRVAPRPESPEGRSRERGSQSGFSLLLLVFFFTLAFPFVLSLRRHIVFFKGPAVVVVSPLRPRPGSVSKETSTPSWLRSTRDVASARRAHALLRCPPPTPPRAGRGGRGEDRSEGGGSPRRSGACGECASCGGARACPGGRAGRPERATLGQ